MASDGSYKGAEDLSEDNLSLKDRDDDKGDDSENGWEKEREGDDKDDGEDEDAGEGEKLSDSDIEEGLAFKEEKDVVEPIEAGREYLPGYLQALRYAAFPQTWTWRKLKFWNRTAEYHPQHLIQQHYKAFADDFNALYQLRYRPLEEIDVETRAVMLEDVSRHCNTFDCLINLSFSSVCTQI